MSDDETRCEVCGLPSGADYGDPHECPPGFRQGEFNLPLHRTEAGYPNCSTCDGGGCLDCTDPA